MRKKVCLGFAEFSGNSGKGDVGTFNFVELLVRYEELMVSGRLNRYLPGRPGAGVGSLR
jgi:hypothetical protein